MASTTSSSVTGAQRDALLCSTGTHYKRHKHSSREQLGPIDADASPLAHKAPPGDETSSTSTVLDATGRGRWGSKVDGLLAPQLGDPSLFA